MDIAFELSQRRGAFEGALKAAWPGLVRDVPPPLAEAMGYSLFAAGKRLRPVLCSLACEALGGNSIQALPAMMAVEMIHTYSLIHDDLPAMDDDDLRRGRPTCHIVYGDALAILAGDALLTLAFEVLAKGCSQEVCAVSTVELAKGAGAAGMVGGQVLDLVSEGRVLMDKPPVAPEAWLEGIHTRKTGALIKASVRLGVLAAGQGHPDTHPEFTRYAECYGLAFQVTDDLLDALGSAETAGKAVGKDTARGKITYPGLLGVDASHAKARGLVAEAVAALAGNASPAAQVMAHLAQALVARDK